MKCEVCNGTGLAPYQTTSGLTKCCPICNGAGGVRSKIIDENELDREKSALLTIAMSTLLVVVCRMLYGAVKSNVLLDHALLHTQAVTGASDEVT